MLFSACRSGKAVCGIRNHFPRAVIRQDPGIVGVLRAKTPDGSHVRPGAYENARKT